MNTTKWISHRGESFIAPENTAEAFALSLELQSDGMECDIHFTRDLKIVCIHDDNTARTGDRDAVIAESDFADLQSIDVSNKKEGYSNCRIPLFAETLKYLGDREYYVEIKAGLVEIIPDMVKVCEEADVNWDQIVMISFDIEVVKAYKAAYPDKKSLLLVSEASITPAEVIERLRYCGADGVDMCCYDYVDAEYVKPFREAGYVFAVWTIDDPERAKRFLDIGVDAITSNRAAYLKEIFSK